MVKIYIIKNGEKSKEFIDISFWSMIKAYVLSALTIVGLIWGGLILLSIIFWGAFY